MVHGKINHSYSNVNYLHGLQPKNMKRISMEHGWWMWMRIN